MVYDVVVVGSGPSGGMAAYEAAKSGLSVAILEKEMLPRYKTCGGGLVFRGRKMLPFDLSSVIEKEFFEVSVYFDHSNGPMTSRRNQPIVTMVMRDKLDKLIIDHALLEGAVLLENHTLRELSFDVKTIHLQTSQEIIKAKYVIAADGALSPTAKMAGWKETRRMMPALEYEVEVSPADFERLGSEARFDIDAIPKGYGYCFPKKKHLSIGVGTYQKDKINMRQYYRAYLEKLGIQEVISEDAHGFQVPVGIRTDGLVRNNIFLTGDAAGFADPLTVEGISNAIYSGTLAGRTIAANFGNPKLAESQYLKALEKKLLPELKFSNMVAGFFYNQKTLRNYLISKNGQRFCETVTDVFMGKKEYSADMKSRVMKKFGLSFMIKESSPII